MVQIVVIFDVIWKVPSIAGQRDIIRISDLLFFWNL